MAPHDTDDERALVAALRGGDPRAFDLVYERHHARLWRYLVRLCRDRTEAEDVFQDTWLAAARHARGLAPDSELRPWLYTIAHNKQKAARRFRLFDWGRKQRFAAEPAIAPPAPDEVVTHRRALVALSSVWPSLELVHKEVLMLCLAEGLDAKRAARVLGVSEEAVRKRLSRARAALAALIGDARRDDAPPPLAARTQRGTR